jgi:hypothetical protein
VSEKAGKNDLVRLDGMRDSDIDYSDTPPLDKTFFKNSTTEWPPGKRQPAIRLDADGMESQVPRRS